MPITKKNIYDLSAAMTDRDIGIALASRNEPKAWWLNAMIIIVRNFPIGWEGLAEDFQPVVVAKLGHKPHVPQVWGALTIALIKMGFLEHTGKHDPCRKRSSHACDGKILRKLA